ncbi:hypothetical protein Pmani_033486 [Petrolisthes manimaculis]|uniref:Zinc finger protein 593 homolog n=1 Tax=Petrolisthes manimaculis TaxID=1843537 RepID=A0AAE1NQU4_9EUCA|nr:hypothetical protein Pmani_033486 [Petrolisthes manimaculis]
MDEIDEDMKDDNAPKLLHQEVNDDLPGQGQNYCLHCARYFISMAALKGHFRTKSHKRRLKNLELEPHTQADADRAAGRGSFIQPKRRKIETQPIDDGTFDPKTEDVDMKNPEPVALT